MGLRKSKILSPQEKENILNRIREILTRHEEILFALLYGSLANPDTEGYGDIDIAIYPRSQIEEDLIEAKLEAEITEELLNNNLNILPVEIINLRRAPYHFRISLLKGPYIILKENEEAFTTFIEKTSMEAMINNHFRQESLREVLED